MSAWAKPGVVVVCIRDDWDEECMGLPLPSRVPMLNEILTITGVVLPEDYLPRNVKILGGAGLSFSETGDDWFYSIKCFKPLITETQAQDIALFRQLLAGLPVGEDA